VSRRGAGLDDDPAREVTQYWSFEGTLLAEHDPHQRFLSPATDAEVVQAIAFAYNALASFETDPIANSTMDEVVARLRRALRQEGRTR